jgi:hypothetical protein
MVGQSPIYIRDLLVAAFVDSLVYSFQALVIISIMMNQMQLTRDRRYLTQDELKAISRDIRLQFWIRIIFGSWIGPDPHKSEKLDSDSHYSKKFRSFRAVFRILIRRKKNFISTVLCRSTVLSRSATLRETVPLRVLYWQVFEVGENKGGVIPPKMNLVPPLVRQSL